MGHEDDMEEFFATALKSVVDDSDKLVGMISSLDLVAALAQNIHA